MNPGRTSRRGALRVAANQTPAQVVTDAALRALLSIEEHEIKEQLRLDGKRNAPVDPHKVPGPGQQDLFRPVTRRGFPDATP